MSDSGELIAGRSIPESSLSRRDFLKRASLAAAGAAAGMGAGFQAKAFAAEEALTVNGLPGTVFGRTGLKVTKISFGGILTTEPPVLLRAIDQGIKLVHTAPGYQNGRSMEAFGRIMKTHRDKVVLALKERPESLDEALKVLNTDYVDILVPPMHSVSAIQDPSIPESFEKARKAGKAGYMGFACHSHMTEVLDKARELGYFDATLLSYGQADSPEFLAAAKRARQAGIGIMTMKGLPKRASEGLSAEEKKTVSSLCTSMVGPQHANTVLASMGSFQAVDSYLEILQTRLGFRDLKLEQRYWAAQQGSYCSNCGSCSLLCPSSGEDIPRIVRYRMYYKDYGLKEYARACYAGLRSRTSPDTLLKDSELCEKVCPRGLPLREIISEARALLA